MITDYHVKMSGDNPTIQQFIRDPQTGGAILSREIDRETADRLGEILAAAHEGDSLARFFASPESAAASVRAEFERGRDAALSDILTELAELEHSETIGIAVWRPWYTGMAMQGRDVDRERRDWDSLDVDDRNLDIGIGTTIVQQLAVLLEGNMRAAWAMEDAGQEATEPPKEYRDIYIDQMPTDPIVRVPVEKNAGMPGDESWNAAADAAGAATGIGGAAVDFAMRQAIAPVIYVSPGGEAIAAKDAAIKDLRDRLSRAGNIKKRLEQRLELEMVKTQIAAERAAAVTYRLEAEQKDRQLETLQLATSVRDQLASRDKEIEHLKATIASGGDNVWKPKYEEVAATLEKVIAERDEQARITNELREQVARLKRADRDAGLLLFPPGVLGDFGCRAWQAMTSGDYTETITEQFADIAEDMRLVRLMTYPGGKQDRKEITERLIRVCARACRIHQRHGEVDKPYKDADNSPEGSREMEMAREADRILPQGALPSDLDDDTPMIEAQEAAIEAEEISQEAYELQDDERGKVDTSRFRADE